MIHNLRRRGPNFGQQVQEVYQLVCMGLLGSTLIVIAALAFGMA